MRSKVYKMAVLAITHSTWFLGCASEELKPMVADSIASNQNVVALTIQDYCSRAGFQYKDFWAIPMSYEIQQNTLLVDFDRDGIPDQFDRDTNLGISRLEADSNGDGYSDLLMYQGGFTIESQERFSLMACNSAIHDDFDHDGLTDCEEENVAHTDTKKWDSDEDDVPDGLEIRVGLNPKDFYDTKQNFAGDQINNLEKIKRNLPVRENSTALLQTHGLVYSVMPATSRGAGCVDLKVSNIPVAPVSNGNLLNLYFFEVDASGHKAMRVESVVIETSDLDPSTPGTHLFRYQPTSNANWSLQ